MSRRAVELDMLRRAGFAQELGDGERVDAERVEPRQRAAPECRPRDPCERRTFRLREPWDLDVAHVVEIARREAAQVVYDLAARIDRHRGEEGLHERRIRA